MTRLVGLGLIMVVACTGSTAEAGQTSASPPVPPRLVLALEWLTRSIFVGTGERYPTEVVIRFWKLE